MSNAIYHNHHIVPRHAGGTDDPSNIIKLTVSEHAEAHLKLLKNTVTSVTSSHIKVCLVSWVEKISSDNLLL